MLLLGCCFAFADVEMTMSVVGVRWAMAVLAAASSCVAAVDRPHDCTARHAKYGNKYDARGTDGGIRKVTSDWASTDSTYGPWLGRAQGDPRPTGTTL